MRVKHKYFLAEQHVTRQPAGAHVCKCVIHEQVSGVSAWTDTKQLLLEYFALSAAGQATQNCGPARNAWRTSGSSCNSLTSGRSRVPVNLSSRTCTVCTG